MEEPEGKKYYRGDWKSNYGRWIEETFRWVVDAVSYRQNTHNGSHGAWKKVEKNPGVVEFLGVERAMPQKAKGRAHIHM